MALWIADRLRFGWVLGHRVVLLEHRSRVTGRPIRTAVDVVRWDPVARHVLVVARSGPGTGWYRDVLTHPLVRVTIGRERDVVGCAVPVGDDEVRGELERARARRPGMARRLTQLVARLVGPGHRPGSTDTAGAAVVIDLAPRRPADRRAHRLLLRSPRRPLAA
jgi:deazaflavin-dependent oxidoreductase (nitroreductase family)